MRVMMKTTSMMAIGAMLLTAACTTDPETGQKRMSNAGIGAIAGTLGGYLMGDLIGGRNDRTAKIVGAGLGGLAGAGIGHYMDEQEKKLREQTAGTGVDVVRQGDELLLNMPSGVTFDTSSATVKPEFQGTLDQVASTLSQYDQTFIDVYGHTDSTGNDAINVPLSQNRAQSVANYLTLRGVQSARIGTQGFAATRPVASNDTPEGRQANRRVEIKIVPITQQDAKG
ncbi:OmpA family protein [Sphingomonas sp. LaA6.9]|uniref:OmpA family protein n=1 Tax=Sphingomonas sp. LaA6.9 TaxID=2919914 RepID=UPI001F500029|nr:OmpA family protein [Sphingomonas sp. LaA6.9]MCJ8158925.1 OmpA family protein [Sphingomonas sp. LaA6.9]